MNQNEEAQWQYKPDDSSSTNQPESDIAAESSADSSQAKPKSSSSTVTWTASEYIQHDHGAGWYGILILSTVGLAAGVYFLTKDYFATGTIAVLGVVVGIFADRKPRQITYEISDSGLRVGDKEYSYSSFKSFAVVREGPINSVSLIPLKRFMPPISAYFAPKDEERIVSVLGEYLPHEDRKLDTIDRLTRRLRL